VTEPGHDPQIDMEHQAADWSWEQTRELYTDWAASWADRSGIKEVLRWRGFPLWWASTLIHKDTYIDRAWYKELHGRLRGLPANPFQPRADSAVYFGIIKNLVNDLGRWLLMRLLPVAKKSGGERIWFHSLEFNLLQTPDGYCDRMYAQAYLDDRKYGCVSAFLLRMSFKKADFRHPWSWRRRVLGLTARLQRDVEVLDRHFHLVDIVGLHVSMIRNYFKFKRFIKPSCREGVRIGRAEFADILFLELQKSFVAYIPANLSQGAMLGRWLQKSRSDKTMVTYGETSAWMRPVYFATRRHSTRHRWISIQHATVYKYKMEFYHRFSEFNKIGPDDGRLIAPGPDYYFVHGRQFADILTEFYPPDRIRTIGCLKYDRLHRLYGTSRRGARPAGSARVMVLAPSTGDEETILRMFAGLRDLPGWRVMLSKHPVVSQDQIIEIIRRNRIDLPIEFDSSKSTIELIEDASLVICGWSGIALESYFLGVPSVRVMNPEEPPMFEDEPGIEYVTNQQDLLRVIATLADGGPMAHVTPEISNTLDRYFFRFDGLASQRFWTHLRQLPGHVDGRAVQS